MNPLLDALLSLSIGGLQHKTATERANPVLDARQRILAERSGAQAVPAVQPEVAPLVPPDRAQQVNDTEVAPRLMPTETITAQEQAVNDNSMDPAQVSDAYKSPPDLSQMYLDMMNNTMRQQQFSSAATLIAAGLAQDQNKGKLIELAGQGGVGATGQGDMFKTIYDLQTKASEAAQKQALRQRLPAIAKAHGISLEDAQVMFEGGSLEEFLKEAASPETEVVERADGSKALLNSKSGEVIREISGAKKGKVEYKKIGNKEVLVDEYGQPVDPNVQLPSEVAIPPKLKWEEEPSTGRKLAYDENTGERLPNQDLAGKTDIELHTMENGTVQPFDKRTGKPIGQPYGPKKDVSTDDIKEYAVARAAAEARGDKIEDFDIWLDRKERLRGPKAVGGGKLEEQLGAKRAEQFSTAFEESQSAVDTIKSVNDARDQLEKGIVAGSELSPTFQSARKIWADVLDMPDEATVNTDVFRSSLKEVVLGKIKSLGSGTAISDADRRYIDAAVGGDVTLDEKAMARIFDILEKGARSKIDKYNKDVDNLLSTYDDPEDRKNVARTLAKIDAPESWFSKKPKQGEEGYVRSPAEVYKQYGKGK